MRIGALARELGTTPQALRFYERQGLLAAARRTDGGYRDYTEDDAESLRLLVGLRQLDLPLGQAAKLARQCMEGRCEDVSQELRELLAAKRQELARRLDALHRLDRRLARLSGELTPGRSPRPLISHRKEEGDGSLS